MLTTDAVNEDIIDHETVLGYFRLFGTPSYAMPFIWEHNDGTNRQHILHTYQLNRITLYAFQTSGVLTPGVNEYRFMLITDNTVTVKSSAGKDILSKLKQAGVDVNNYNEVIDYFGLDY